MASVFFCGTLCHDPLRAVVIGADHAAQPAHLPAHLPGHRLVAACDGAVARLVGDASADAAGVAGFVLTEVPADVQARLDHHAAAQGMQPAEAVVNTPDGPLPVRLHRAAAPADSPPWQAVDWQARFADAATATAADVMALMGQVAGADIARRLGAMLVRGASRVRAGQAAPAIARRPAAAVRIADRRLPYANFFSVEEYDLAFRRFDGSMSPTVNRAAFVSGDAVTVLPYDPRRDRVLLVEQFRTGPFARGDHTPWQLEPIAGRIDPGETPEDCARREAVEEAGLTLGQLLPVAGYYPSPGAKTEYLYSFVALCDLPDGCAGVFGVADEAEDIRGHLLPFARLSELVALGEVSNAPLLLTALWLERERPRLMDGA